jgi:hypothetical protein
MPGLPIPDWSRLSLEPEFGGLLLWVERCGNCGVICFQQLCYGVFFNEVEDEAVEDC